MTLHNKNKTDDISRISDCTTFEQLIEWCKVNNKAVAIVLSAMLFHSLILAGIIVVLSSGSSTDRYISEYPSHQVSQPESKPIEESEYTIEDTEDSTIESSEVQENDSALYSAYEAGWSTGELFIESRDAVTDFFKGFNEATGAMAWARERWDSGKERVTEWIDENLNTNDNEYLDEIDSDFADID
jgi:hypothetical protein